VSAGDPTPAPTDPWATVPRVRAPGATDARAAGATIPAALVCGFLGSGKTTVLSHLARRLEGRRIAWLVNEFSSRDIDAAILRAIAPDVRAVPGGSIFCRCIVSRFIEELRGIAEQEPPTEGLVVEASGVADPRVVHRMLSETRLDLRYRLECVVAVVDPGRFLKLVHTLPNIRAQVEASDVVLINKADLYPEETLRAAEEEVQRIRPAARTLRTVRGAGEIPFLELGSGCVWAGDSAGHDSGDYAPSRDPAFVTRELSLGRIRDVEGFRRKLEALSADLYRVKGFVPSESGMLLVEASGGEVSVGPSPVAVEGPVLVLVLRAGFSHETAAFLDRLQLGLEE
jgi:G3E family GTPase